MSASPLSLRRVLLAAGVAFAGAIGWAIATPSDAHAADAADFDPGMIIADSLFYDGAAMTVGEIQQFLDGKVAVCQSGYTCLKDFRQTTATIAPDAFCDGYTGAANETAASIIRRVGASCGVSQKALLVLIQKEQGLVTHTWPSTYRYDKLTGYACPDTSSCNPDYAGFLKQLYYGARQYKVYAAYPSSYNYRAGENNRIYYHPPVLQNGSWVYTCGSSTVYIENQATAGLYNYTPYQPNKAALANLYGTGDSCSSYGNRNFWRLYTDWFGSTSADPVDAIATERRAQGGADGWLGAPLGGVKHHPATGGYYREFERSVIAWTPEHGAHTVARNLVWRFRNLGGVDGSLGLPTGDAVDLEANGGGRYQEFTAGTLLRTSRGAYEVDGGMLSRYLAIGGPESDLGWPTGFKTKHPGPYWTQDFTGGRFYSNIATIRYVGDEFLALYEAAGELSGTLGWPSADPVIVDGGSWQEFASATLYASPAGAFKVSSAVLEYYVGLGGPTSDLGWPRAGKIQRGPSLWTQDFTGGRVYSDRITVRYVGEEFLEAYVAAGETGGALGWPTTDVTVVTQNGGGAVQQFGETTLFASAHGVFPLSGQPLADYLAAGGPSGPLGWPTGDPTEHLADGGGQAWPFSGGTLFVSSHGAVPVRGAMLDFYLGLGGPDSALGWPVGDKVKVSGPYWTQDFVGGRLYSNLVHLGYVPTDALEAYEGYGGPEGRLGWPTGAPTAYAEDGGGTVTPFSLGMLAQSRHGGQIVRGSMLRYYVELGGPASELGWPRGNKTKHPGPYWTQDFVGGRLYSDSRHLAHVDDALVEAYEGYGGVTGRLGWPAGPVNQRKYGIVQSFDKGDLFSSASGTYAVDGRMLTYYWSIGGPARSLGWPAGDKTKRPGPIWTQQFAGGVLESDGRTVTHTLG